VRLTTKEATIMKSINLTRIGQTFALAAVVLVALAPGVAVGKPMPYSTHPDVFERYAIAHPYGEGALEQPAPDVFERYAATHPYGDTVTILDGRSPDTLDAADSAALQVVDGRSPDTLDAASTTALQVVDGRSPDTIDAAQAIQPIEVVQAKSSFDWSDASIGAGLGAGMILVLSVLGGALVSHRRGHRVQAT
jgi:hypothetical protein